MTTNEAKVERCEAIIKYELPNKLKCLEALQASGHTLRWDRQLVPIRRNDSLAVFGDAATKAYLCRRWYDSGRSKGQWTQAEQALLSNTNLSAVGYEHGLHDCVILNQGTLSVSNKTMATTVEAILGAVFMDGGADALGTVLVTLGLDRHPFLESVTSYSCLPLSAEFSYFSLR
ncbi:ribonuclease III domain-containing protein [Exophiala viscosa]|uniref:Ribonuclease III domain-containing protein n=1 Tax=Exophiala viscosa TaxID=2486360 RepID=A0AAN6DXK5_9EURO|nr:ribonuclease III domain-containing protein [Exophiala viscosa]